MIETIIICVTVLSIALLAFYFAEKHVKNTATWRDNLLAYIETRISKELELNSKSVTESLKVNNADVVAVHTSLTNLANALTEIDKELFAIKAKMNMSGQGILQSIQKRQ